MLTVWVCAAHMGGILGPKFSKQGSFFPLSQKLSKKSSFPWKFNIKVGPKASFDD